MQFFRVLFVGLFLTVFSFAQVNLEENALRFKWRIGFTEPDERIVAQKFLGEGQKAVLVGKKSIQIWDVPGGRLLETRPHEIKSLDDIDAFVQISPDGRMAVVMDSFSWRIVRKEKKVSASVYDLDSGKLIKVLERPAESIRHAEWSADGATLVTYSDLHNDKRTEICFWDGKDLSLRAALTLKGYFYSPYLSRDGKWLMTSTSIGTTGFMGSELTGENATIVWNTETGKMRQKLTYASGDSFHVLYIREGISPDEKLFVGSSGKNILVWEIGGGSLPKYEIKATKKGDYIYFDGFSDDTRYLLAQQKKSIEFYDAANGNFEFSMPIVKSYTDAKLLEDGATLLLQSCERAEVYDLPSRQKLYEIRLVCKSQTDLVSSYYRDFDFLRFHPSVKLLLTYSDKTVRLWNARTGLLVQTMADPNRVENKKKDPNKDDGLAWQAGWLVRGEYLFASGADKKTILLWQLDKNFQ